MIDLIFKDVKDDYAAQNFFRLRKFIGEQVLFDGNFKLFDITIPAKSESFKVLHGLTFIPADIIQLSAQGDLNYYFNFQNFDKDFLYITTNGPVRIRFLAGKLKDQLRGNQNVAPFGFVAPGDVIRPASPGFVYAAVADKTTGFWLTQNGIPSNVNGIPVLFGDGIIIQAAVGAELESDYTIGVYQHEGQAVNMTQLGSFNVVTGGPKRFGLSLPIVYSSPNVQLACRLESGDTLNMSVSLVLKGSSI